MQFIDDLVGREFLEMELYELLLFDIEERLSDYFQHFVHLYFERLPDQRIKVTEVIYFANQDEQYLADRKLIEKREWFRIRHQCSIIDLLLCRFDRSGFGSSIGTRWGTHTQSSFLQWADEWPPMPRLTDEERRLAYLELAGLLDVSVELEKSKKKSAM